MTIMTDLDSKENGAATWLQNMKKELEDGYDMSLDKEALKKMKPLKEGIALYDTCNQDYAEDIQ